MSMHNASLSTSTCTTLPLAYHHVSPSVNTTVWTLVNMHLSIASLNPLYPACPCTMQFYLHIHVLHCHLHITMCHHLWTLLCEHYCVNMHLSIASLNPLYPACPCTMQVYLHIHVLHCHLHITMCHHLWTLCEHYCVNMHLWIVSLKALYPACPCTIYCHVHLHVLHCHLHITMCQHLWTLCEHASVNMHLSIASWNVGTWWYASGSVVHVNVHDNKLCMDMQGTKQVYLHLHVLHCHLHITMCHHLWTLLCELASVNCFFKSISPCMSMHNATLSTYTRLTWILTCTNIY